MRDETLPGLERLKDRLAELETKARAEAAGGIDLEGERDAAWREVKPSAVSLETDAPVSLQGAAAKVRYERQYRIGDDEADSAECRLLLQAAKTLEVYPSRRRKPHRGRRRHQPDTDCCGGWEKEETAT